MEKENRSDELHFTMGDGREVSLDAMVLERADNKTLYQIGYIDDETESVGAHREKVMRLWSQPPCHFIQEVDHSDDHPTPYCLTAWLSSGPIPGSSTDRSQLVVVVIVNYGRGQQIETLFNTYVGSVDWDSLAWPV